MKKSELLAPAGNMESFLVALNNGADAIYLGIDEFNARGNIENFNLENIEEVTNLAHLFGIKIYITLNILISDSEMEKVVDLAGKLLKAKIDAFIIQDLGLAMAIKNTYPNAVLHASTQMGICNLEGAKLVKKLGFTRVVLARETPLEEIRRIHENCDIEIEYFVQGALCVAYSGNCYFSSLQAGASGNRGKCKQFCRLPYIISDGRTQKEGYLLSAKDFCMIDRLSDLTSTGVCSLKIEGRARRAGYVGQSVLAYRKAIDDLNENKIDKNNLKQSLKTAFNRGDFIEGYFNDDKKIDSHIQGHRGLEIGKVVDFKKGKKFNVVTLKSTHEIVRGDGLKFISNDKEISSIGVNDVKTISKDLYQITTLVLVDKNCKVFLTLDKINEDTLLASKRKIQIFASFSAEINQKARLLLKNQDGISIEVFSEEVLLPAQNQPLTKEEVEQQLVKGSEFFDINLKEIYIENVFMRKSQLNELRRQAIQEMKDKIISEYNEKNIKPYVKQEYKLECQDVKSNDSKMLLFSNIEELEKEKITPNTKLVYCPENYILSNIKKVCQSLKDYEIYLSTPIFAGCQDIKMLKLIFSENANLNIYANNYYGLNLIEDRKVIASNNLNIFNSQSVKALKCLGVEDAIVSIESKEKLKNSGVRLYSLENYKPMLMTFVHCPFKEHFGSDCKNCKFKNNVRLFMQNKKSMSLKRTKLATCLFSIHPEESLGYDENYLKAKVLFD